MFRAEQAVMGQAEGLRQEHRVRVGVCPYLIKHSRDRRLLTTAVVGFRRQPGTDPERERCMRLKQRKDLLKPGFQLRRAGNRPSLANPQPGQAEGGQCHRVHVVGRDRKLVGLLEVTPACVQVAIGMQRLIAVREG